jgi:hypothetical protein
LSEVLQEAKVVLFVDGKVYYSLRTHLTSLKWKINEVMKQLGNWFLTNNLIINMEKTKAIFLNEEDLVKFTDPLCIEIIKKELTHHV